MVKAEKYFDEKKLPLQVELLAFPRNIVKKLVFHLNPYKIFFQDIPSNKLSNGEFAIFNIDDASIRGKLELITKGYKHYAFFSDELSVTSLNTLISNYHPKFIISSIDLEKQNIENTHKLFKKAYHIKEGQRFLEQIKIQNKELEELTDGLEKIVEARTKDIEDSKNIVLHKQKKLKGIVHLVKHLSQVDSIEDLLKIIRIQIRVYSKIRDPILAYQKDKKTLQLVSFQGNEVVIRNIKEHWPRISKLRYNDFEDRAYLANIFGRPFIKLIAIPFFIRSSKEPAILYIEHSLDKKESSELLLQLKDGLEPFYMALDRVLLRDKVARTSSFWEKTFDSIEDPVAIISKDLEVIRANKKFVQNIDLKTNYQGFVKLENSHEFGIAQNGSTKNLHIDNKAYEVLTYPIVQENGEIHSYVNYYLDISISQKLYSKLIQSEKMAALGLLAGNIAHELNNPLTGLRSMAQTLLLEVPETESIFNDLKEIEQAAKRSQTIIKNLLEFSNGEQIERKKISISEIIRKTLPFLKSALSRHKLRLDLQDKDKDFVFINSNLLQQVIFNLLNNATQAMEKPGEICIQSKCVNNGIELKISDTGQGIAESEVESIFEAFYTTKKEGKGTGLGLSMSKSIIENANGYLSVESKVNSGSCFKIGLPLY